MLLRRLATTLPLVCILLCARAQRPVSFAYYDADRLYDTLPALFYDDSDFTPKGRMHWDSERYRHKIRNTAALLDSMRMNLIAVSGIETEEVLRDLTAACREEYSYLHRTLNNFDGLDITLLYHGDRFAPAFTQEGRGWLYVEGHLDGMRIGLLLCHNARYAVEALTDCIEAHPDIPLIAAGRFPTAAPHTDRMTDTHARAEAVGRGTIRYQTGWRMSDRILADTSLRTQGGDVYARRWLMDRAGSAPRPTYERQTYRGGYGRSLPVFVYITLPAPQE